MPNEKSIKDYAKEAKKRLKQGFWQEYGQNLKNEMERARVEGIPENKVKEYYAERVVVNIKNGKAENEEFYQKVKTLLDNEGEVSNAIGRLTDEKLYDTLSYEEKQRYTLSLSEKYLSCVERYNKEKAIEKK